jgi:hypothetical protein
MAVQIRHWCDRCSEEIPPIDRVSYKGTSGVARYADPVNMCSSCHAKFLTWLGPGPLKSPEPARPSRGRRPAATAPSGATAKV